jgi:hypothetical protein
MNYQQYLEIKRGCEKKIKIYSYAVYMACIFSMVQVALLFLKVNYTVPFINMILIDKLYSMGYARIAVGNVIFGYAFYAAVFAIVASFLIGSVLVNKQNRLAYLNVIVFYIIDSLLCIATAAYYQLALHLVVLLLVFIALRNRNYLQLLKKNIWGYK